MYSEACAVTIESIGKGKTVEGSGSGILIDRKKGHVLTHASVLLPVIHDEQHLIESITSQKCGDADFSFLTVTINMQWLQNHKTDPLKITQSGFTVLGRHNCASDKADRSVHTGRVQSVFQCHNFKQSIDELFPHESWKLNNEEVGEDKNGKDSSVISTELSLKLLSYFVLLQLTNWSPSEEKPIVFSVSSSNIGDPVLIEATPFGGLSPEVFLNSQSQGVLSNVHGRNSCLLLTDARCIPGSEGGALYIKNKKKRYLAGIIAVSLCWKNNEWVGLTIACSLVEVVSSLIEFAMEREQHSLVSTEFSSGHLSKWLYPLSAVSLIQVGGRWGSGVLIDSRTIISCAHVVSGDNSLPIKCKLQQSNVSEKAKVLFRTSPTKVFDIALMEVCSKERPIQVSFSMPEEGDRVFVIGHGLFNSEHLLPSITSGIISKILFVNRLPIMIQTSCAVHAGASGGAVVNESGELIGIAVCNAKDRISGASFPHVNMSIPMVTVWPLIQEFLRSRDTLILSQLDISNTRVTNLWSLNEKSSSSASVTAPASKL